MAVKTAPIKSADASLAEQLAALEPRQRERALLEAAPDDETAEALLYDWDVWGRPKQQLPPGDWFVAVWMAGRGFGKTRTGAEAVCKWAHDFSPIALVGAKAADVRDVQVEEGPSSILKISPPWWRPKYEPSKRRLTFPNGAVCITFGADEADSLRGPQFQKAWADELAKWRRLKEAWDNLVFGVRLGDRPQIAVTTTPKPKKVLREIIRKRSTVVVRGSMYENRANLSPIFIQEVEDRYAGSRTGRQEIEGEYLEDIEGALIQRKWIDDHRRRKRRNMLRVNVAIDPAASSGPDSNDTGITVQGTTRIPGDKRLHFDVIADRTCHLPPNGWAREAIKAYEEFKADFIVAEVNNGGEMVKATIHNVDPNVRVKMVHATRGKAKRAEPISILYEQGRVHHVTPKGDELVELEDQLCSLIPPDAPGQEEDDPADSPDRADAVVWGLTELSKGQSFGAA